MAKEPKLKLEKAPKVKKAPKMKEIVADEPEASNEEKVVEPRLSLDAPPEGQGVPATSEPSDYLRQYQYRKQVVPGSIKSDPPAGSKAAVMKEFMLSQPLVNMFIPRAMGEASSVFQSVNLDGYRLDFPKDTYIDVPKNVADVLRESLKQTNAALRFKLIDGDKEKESALL